MSLKVLIRPAPDAQPATHGIGRVVHAMYEHLPKYDIELVSDERKAEVIARHTNDDDGRRTEIIFCHGLYFSGDADSGKYDNWHHTINRKLVESIKRALAITVPSDWVAEPFRRDMRIQPAVIPHGIDVEAWRPADKTDGYILWNKNRSGDVCDPTPAWELANRGYRVISTFAPDNRPLPDTLGVMGVVPESEMRGIVQKAYVYLATTKETFGIGTLEALSSGVPVVGFDWGGTHDLVTQNVDGVLVKPYDYAALDKAVEYVHQHHAEMRDAAREKAKQYTWPRAMKLYADLFRQVAYMRQTEASDNGVAVVTTSYNYGSWLKEALRSLINQSLKPSEVVVVDDASSDDTLEVANEYEQRFSMEGIKYHVVKHEQNKGVAASRNHGVEASHSPFVVCLDADDRLNPIYLRACRDAMLRDRSIGIAYSGLGIIQPNGIVSGNVWTGKFDWKFQAEPAVPPHTTIPTAAMFRREMWRRSGGYRQRYAPGEDAEFYTRGLSLGFNAVKVMDSPLIEYRNHGRGAHLTKQYVQIDDDKPWMHDKQYPIGAPSKSPPLVRSYSDPLVAVFVGDGDGVEVKLQSVWDTIESLVGQDWREWELIVDRPSWSASVMLYPFAKKEKVAPICVRVKAGTVLQRDFLTKEIERFIREGNEWNGDEKMGSCCGGKLDARQLAELRSLKELHMSPPTSDNVYEREDGVPVTIGDRIRMEFIGDEVGAITFFGNSGRHYRGGNNALEKFQDVHKDDVPLLESRGKWRIVMQKPQEVKRDIPRDSEPDIPEPDVVEDSEDTRPRVAHLQPTPRVADDAQEVVPDRFKPVAVPDEIMQDFDSVPEEVVQAEVEKVTGVRQGRKPVKPEPKPRGRPPRRAHNEIDDDDPLMKA